MGTFSLHNIGIGGCFTVYKCSEFRWAEHSAWSALNTAQEQVLLHHNIVYISFSLCGQAPVIIESETSSPYETLIKSIHAINVTLVLGWSKDDRTSDCCSSPLFSGDCSSPEEKLWTGGKVWSTSSDTTHPPFWKRTMEPSSDQPRRAGHGACSKVWSNLRVLRHVNSLAFHRRPVHREKDTRQELRQLLLASVHLFRSEDEDTGTGKWTRMEGLEERSQSNVQLWQDKGNARPAGWWSQPDDHPSGGGDQEGHHG